MKQLPLFALVLLAAACAPNAGPGTVTATDAFCWAAPASAPAAGCYVTLTASEKDRLVSVATTVADHAEIHTMSVDGGVMRMRQLKNGIALPKGVPVSLKPGGMHLMLIGPKAELAAGGVAPQTLTIRDAPPVTLSAPIRARVAPRSAAAADQAAGMEHEH